MDDISIQLLHENIYDEYEGLCKNKLFCSVWHRNDI